MSIPTCIYVKTSKCYLNAIYVTINMYSIHVKRKTLFFDAKNNLYIDYHLGS